MHYVLSDIHGNIPRFRSVMEQIDLKAEDTLYVLGDVIDRYPGGIKLLRELMAMPNVQMLLGNHEYMMLRALGEPYDGPEDLQGTDPDALLALWYRNGGNVTHHFWKHIRKTVRADILDYLKALSLEISLTVAGVPFLLVHAAPRSLFETRSTRPGETPTHFSVWNREAIFAYPQDAPTLIFGHTPTQHFQNEDPLCLWRQDNVIGIDCGCCYPPVEPGYSFSKEGRLCCLRLEDMEVFYSKETQG